MSIRVPCTTPTFSPYKTLRTGVSIVVSLVTLLATTSFIPAVSAESIGSTQARDGLPSLSGESGGPVLFSVSETLNTGDTGNLSGGNFNATAKAVIQPVASNGTRGASQEMSIRNLSPFLIQADVPSGLTRGLWAVWVEETVNGTLVASNEIFVNQATVKNYLTGTIAIGETLEIIGRNMVQDPNDANSYQDSVVEFVHGSTHLPATVTSGTEYSLKVTAPAGLVTGTSYDVYVSNGWGGSVGLHKAEPDYPLSIVDPGVADVFDLKVPWARDLTYATDGAKVYNVLTDVRLATHAVADGDTTKTDNYTAINNAISYITTHGGGILYMPAGNYFVDVNVSSRTIELHANVVIKGDGIGSTTISYGQYGVAPITSLMTGGSGTSSRSSFGKGGLYNLSIVSANAEYSGLGNVPPGVSYGISFSFNQGKLFLKNVEYKMGPHERFNIGDAHETVVENSTFTNHYRYANTFDINADGFEQESVPGTFNVIRNNTFTYLYGRMSFVNLIDSAVEDNSIIHDVSAQPDLQDDVTCCSGGIAAAYSSYTIFRNNTIHTINQTPGSRLGTNAGESFLDEIHTQLFSQLGTVTSSTSTTITDTGKDWDTEDRWPTQANRISFGNPDCGGANYTCNPLPSYIHPDGTAKPYQEARIRRPVIAITDGVGIGQVRHIVSNTSTSITIDKPWDLQPQAGSKYKLTYFNTESQLIVGNDILSGGGAGIWLYSGGYDAIISDNTLTDAGSIAVYGNDQHGGTSQKSCNFLGYRDYNTQQLREAFNMDEGKNNVPTEFNTCYEQHLAWKISIRNNTISDTSGVYPAAIQVLASQFQNPDDYPGSYTSRPVYHGNTMFGIEVRNNTINANSGSDLDTGYLTQLSSNAYHQINYDFMPGNGVYVMNGGSAFGHQQDVGGGKVTLGTIIQDNTVNNLDSNPQIQPYHFSNGVAQTTLRYSGYTPTPTCYNVQLSGLTDKTVRGVATQLIDTGRSSGAKKFDKQLVTRLEEQVTNAQGVVQTSDPVTDFLLHYKFSHQDITGSVNWTRVYWDPVTQGSQSYTLWFKAPGFLGKKVSGIAASDLLNGSACQTVIGDQNAATPGDFNGDNQVTGSDLTAAINGYKGNDPTGYVNQAYGGKPSIADLVSVVRNSNNGLVGDTDTP